MRDFIAGYGYLIVLFPLLGVFVNGLLGRQIQRTWGERSISYVGCGSVFLSFVLACAAFFSVAITEDKTILCHVYTWIDAGYVTADVSFLFDPLSSVMILIVTGVGFLIHCYSTGYMRGDPGYYRFFAYLNLFIASMLILVLAENMLLLFIGWEGVGLCSYLLIAFWYGKTENAVAGNKAFIVNRVGDLGFFIALLLLFWLMRGQLMTGGMAEISSETPSLLSFSYLAEHVHVLKGVEVWGISAATLICLCLFFGATGKSAQIPLYVWLPDAMAGPTPVSALIHAATMVTAGVYMIGRLHFLFSMSSVALGVIAAVGASTALFAATIGCTQYDIKRVLAYSTISQLGYMFLAMGVAAYSAGIFHLMTHAFFKACLFLGAGSVIIGMHHKQDIRWMGGLKRSMPRTFLTFLVAALALSGIPPLAGFFSKDEILWKAWIDGHPVLWLMGLLTAGLTAFYMTRLVLLTFYGENRSAARPEGEGGHNHTVRESPHSMTVPLILLAFFSVIAGFIGIPEALGGSNRFDRFLGTVFGLQSGGHHQNAMEYVLMAASVLIAVLGIFLGVVFYRIRPDLPGTYVPKIRILHTIVYNKYFIDEVYNFLFVSGTKALMTFLAAFDKYVIDLIVNLQGYILRIEASISGWFDLRFVDGAVNLVADGTLGAGSHLRKLQTGRVQAYVLVFIIVIAVAVAYVVL